MLTLAELTGQFRSQHHKTVDGRLCAAAFVQDPVFDSQSARNISTRTIAQRWYFYYFSFLSFCGIAQPLRDMSSLSGSSNVHGLHRCYKPGRGVWPAMVLCGGATFESISRSGELGLL